MTSKEQRGDIVDDPEGPRHRNGSIDRFVEEFTSRGRVPLPVDRSSIWVDIGEGDAESLRGYLKLRGLISPTALAEHALRGADVSAEAHAAGVDPCLLGALYSEAIAQLGPDLRREIEWGRDQSYGLGQLNPDDPADAALLAELGDQNVPKLDLDVLRDWLDDPMVTSWIPRSATHAVDHRPFLGPARNQGGRGTCTAFGSTAVAEAFEFFRDPRDGPRDFSEQLVFWYSKRGDRYTTGGYSCYQAMLHHSEYGTCEEEYFPYERNQLVGNHAHVPIGDQAMERAPFYRTPGVVELPQGDVDALKDVLRSGRCAGIIHDAVDWQTTTGTYTFPDPLDSAGRGSNHCTAIIGFIDRDDLPGHFEGGYFIQRNSWGGAGSLTNVLGPEYGGHLLMPYGWYSRYTRNAYTLADPGQGVDRSWLVEYFDNPDLSGAPIKEARTEVEVFLLSVSVSAEAPEVVDELDFDWGTGSPLRYQLPLGLGTVDLMPRDEFSARFSTVKRMREGWHRFTLSGDDGVRLWVDDTLVINQWHPQPPTTYSVDHHVTGGDHVLRVEYYERTGRAEVSVDVVPIEFRWDVFANTELEGAAVDTFEDTLTAMEWRHAPPAAGYPHGRFSMRGTATMNLDAGTYFFDALHTGGCRIYVGKRRVLDAWVDPEARGEPIELETGPHQIRVEFKHEGTVPAPGENGYYRAALSFGWSRDWRARFYQDTRPEIPAADRSPDHDYTQWRTRSLTGSPVLDRRYDVDHLVAGEYRAREWPNLELTIPDETAFTADLPDFPDVTGDHTSTWLQRRVFVPEAATYRVSWESGAASRITIDGKQVLEDHVTGSTRSGADVFFDVGFHDIGVEWAVSKWGKHLSLTTQPVRWEVRYFHDTDLQSLAGLEHLDTLDEVLDKRPAAVGSTWFSVRAVRTLDLPLGRYRFQVRCDDSVRLRVNGVGLVEAWDQNSTSSHDAEFEHRGGSVRIEIEHRQRWGTPLLEFDYRMVGYYAEYYEGSELEQPRDGSGLDRNVPIAYRFEPAVRFDWGRGNHLARVGSDRFSARWRGSPRLPVGRWRVHVRADDGVRVFVDGRLLIDEWQNQPVRSFSRMVDLVGRSQDVRVEYYESGGDAVCELDFERVF